MVHIPDANTSMRTQPLLPLSPLKLESAHQSEKLKETVSRTGFQVWDKVILLPKDGGPAQLREFVGQPDYTGCANHGNLSNSEKKEGSAFKSSLNG